MVAGLPPTLDGLLREVESKGQDFLVCLRKLGDYAGSRMAYCCEDEKKNLEELSFRIWQTIGMAEGACRMLDLAKEMRSRCPS
jgi:hypothetical protein